MPSVFSNTVGFGVLEMAIRDELLWSMRLRPTIPELLPRPCGWRSLADDRRRAAELMAPADRATTSAVYSSRSPSWSTMTLLTEPPSGLVSRRTTRELVRRVTLGWRRAGSTHTTWASALALTRQANPSQVEHRMHGLVPGFCSSIMIPRGRANGVSPAPLRSWASCSIRASWLMAG